MKALIFLLALSLTTVFAQDHSLHTKKEQHASKATKKLLPTAELKVRMEKISGLMKELKAKKSDSKIASDYGVKISDVVSDIFKTCKLEPAADEAIHPVLATILEGTEDMKKGSIEPGYSKIHKSLLDYEKLFQLK